jgi:hypothetical protein
MKMIQIKHFYQTTASIILISFALIELAYSFKIDRSRNIRHEDGEADSDRQLVMVARNADIFSADDDHHSNEKIDGEGGQFKIFNVNGKLYNAKYRAREQNLPVMMMVDHDQIKQVVDGGACVHDVFYDLDNHATFTISRYRYHTADKKSKSKESISLRGNILTSEGELVLEPYLPGDGEISAVNYKVIDEHVGGGLTKIYRRSYDRFKEGLGQKHYRHANEVQTLFKNHDDEQREEAKRQNGPINNYVELMALFDYQFYSRIASDRLAGANDRIVANYLEAYAVQLINMANLCYQRSLANVTNLKITLVPKYFLILKTEDASSFTRDHFMSIGGRKIDRKGRYFLESVGALDDLNIWLRTKIYKGILPKDFDSAVHISGTNLYASDGSNLLGIAATSGACRYSQIGFSVEDSFALDSYLTIAHELAHHLGVQHDIDNNPDREPECSEEANYIMATSPQGENFLNQFYFSPCSIRSLVDNIYTNNQLKCIANSVSPPGDVQFLSTFFPGQVFNLTEQCKLAYNESYFPRFGKRPDVEDGEADAYFEDNV